MSTTPTTSPIATEVADQVEAEFPEYVATIANRWQGQDLLVGGEHARSVVRLAHEYGAEDGLTVYAMTANEVMLYEARFTSGTPAAVVLATVRAAAADMIARQPFKWER